MEKRVKAVTAGEDHQHLPVVTETRRQLRTQHEHQGISLQERTILTFIGGSHGGIYFFLHV